MKGEYCWERKTDWKLLMLSLYKTENVLDVIFYINIYTVSATPTSSSYVRYRVFFFLWGRINYYSIFPSPVDLLVAGVASAQFTDSLCPAKIRVYCNQKNWTCTLSKCLQTQYSSSVTLHYVRTWLSDIFLSQWKLYSALYLLPSFILKPFS